MASQSRVDFLQCSICFERKDRRNPRMLACQHSFCQECLLAWHAEHPGRKRYIECPMCREGTQIPSGGIKSLPLDFRLEEVATILKGSVKKTYCQPCSYNSKECLVTAICKTCSGRFCKTCAEEHTSSDLFSKHRIVTELCAEHVSYLDYMCLTCMQGICVECCWSEKHKGHKLVDKVQGETEIKARCSKMQTSIRETITNLERELHTKCRQYEDHQHKVEQQLRMNGEKLKRKIDETIQECIEQHKRKHTDILHEFTEEYHQVCRKAQESVRSAEDAMQHKRNMLIKDINYIYSSLERAYEHLDKKKISLDNLQPLSVSTECCAWMGIEAVYEKLEECNIRCDIGTVLIQHDKPQGLTQVMHIICDGTTRLWSPRGLAVMSDGSAVIGEYNDKGDTVYKVNLDGTLELIYHGETGGIGAFCAHTEYLYIAKANGEALIEFLPGKEADIKPWTPPMPPPKSICVYGDNIYVLHEKGIVREALSGHSRKEIIKGDGFRSFLRVQVGGHPRNIVTLARSPNCIVYNDSGDVLYRFDLPLNSDSIDHNSRFTLTADGNILTVNWDKDRLEEYKVDGSFVRIVDVPLMESPLEVSYRYPYLWIIEIQCWTDGDVMVSLNKFD